MRQRDELFSRGSLRRKFIIHFFIHIFNEHLLDTYHVPGIVPGTDDTIVKKNPKQNSRSHVAYILMGKGPKTNINM